MELKYYEPFGADEVAGVERFRPEDFRPSVGTILVVVPPKISEIGSLALPEQAQRTRGYVRAAAIPDDPKCPVKPGYVVICHAAAPTPVPFAGRKDLALLNYSNDAGTEILGWFEPESFEPDPGVTDKLTSET